MSKESGKESFQIRIREEQKEILDKVKEMEDVSSYHKAFDYIIEDSSYTDKFERIDELFERIKQEVPNSKMNGKEEKFQRIKALLHQTINIDDPSEYKKNRGYLPENYKKLFLDSNASGPKSGEGKDILKAKPDNEVGVE